MRVEIGGINNSHWNGGDRPDRNLQGVVLAPGESITQREEINRRAIPNFTISLFDAATGARISSSRAAFIRSDKAPVPAAWRLAPQGPRLPGGGGSLVLSSNRASMDQGIFTVANATAGRLRSGRVDGAPSPGVDGAQSSQVDGARAPGLVTLSRGSTLTITNNSDTTVRLGVSEIDNTDWDGDNRPDHNLQGLVLAPGESTTQTEEVNYWSTPAFTLTLYDATTGAEIGSSRAMFTRRLFGTDSMTIWSLIPQSQTFSNGDDPLVFASMDPNADMIYKGVFTLENGTATDDEAATTDGFGATLRRGPQPA